jgi:hypothetical protein
MQREIFKIDLSSANLTARIFQMDSSAAFNENPRLSGSALSRRLSKDQYVKYLRKNAKREMTDKRMRDVEHEICIIL